MPSQPRRNPSPRTITRPDELLFRNVLGGFWALVAKEATESLRERAKRKAVPRRKKPGVQGKTL